MKRHQHAIYGLYLPDRPDAILYAGSWRVATLDERLRQHRNGECKTTAKMAARGGVALAALRMRVLAYWMSGVDPNPENEVTLGLQGQGWCRWNHPYAFSSEDSQRGGHIGGHIGGRMGNREGKARGGRNGSRNQPREARVRGGRTALGKRSPEQRVACARIGGRKTAESGWHQTPEAHEAHVRGGRIGGRIGGLIGGRNCSREDHARAGRIGMSKMSREDHARGGRLGNCARWHSDRPRIDRLCAECAAKGAQTVAVSLA